jgi:hypothetical protein
MSVNPLSGFEWIEFLKVSPPSNEMKVHGCILWEQMGVNLEDDDLLIVCLGMLPS